MAVAGETFLRIPIICTVLQVSKYMHILFTIALWGSQHHNLISNPVLTPPPHKAPAEASICGEGAANF